MCGTFSVVAIQTHDGDFAFPEGSSVVKQGDSCSCVDTLLLFGAQEDDQSFRKAQAGKTGCRGGETSSLL